MKDLSQLAIVAAIAIGLYYLMNSGLLNNSVIKNEGMVSLEAENEMEQRLRNYAEKEVVHPQIETIQPESEYMKRVANDELYKNNTNVLPHPQISNSYAPQGNFQSATDHNFSQLDCFPKDQLTAEQLLPRENAYNVWKDSNPDVQGHLANKNFIESGHHYGLNTVSSTLKNPNLQLRSDPLIPKRNVGPWLQSTYEADTNRRPFEIGGC